MIMRKSGIGEILYTSGITIVHVRLRMSQVMEGHRMCTQNNGDAERAEGEGKLLKRREQIKYRGSKMKEKQFGKYSLVVKQIISENVKEKLKEIFLIKRLIMSLNIL